MCHFISEKNIFSQKKIFQCRRSSSRQNTGNTQADKQQLYNFIIILLKLSDMKRSRDENFRSKSSQKDIFSARDAKKRKIRLKIFKSTAFSPGCLYFFI